jgi:hypothetical protein
MNVRDPTPFLRVLSVLALGVPKAPLELRIHKPRDNLLGKINPSAGMRLLSPSLRLWLIFLKCQLLLLAK